METYFEVKTVIQKEFVVAFFQRYLRYRIWILAGYAVILAGWILECILGNFFVFWTSLVLLAVGVWIYYLPWFHANRMMKQEEKFRDGVAPVFSVTFAEKIQSTTTEGSYAIPYDKVVGIYNIRFGIVLMDARKRMLMLDKDGFTKGNFEEFLPFIREKCPQAKQYK